MREEEGKKGKKEMKREDVNEIGRYNFRERYLLGNSMIFSVLFYSVLCHRICHHIHTCIQ